MDLRGRRALVTGANTGLGFRTALGLATAGAGVVLAVRSVEKGQAAAARIAASVPGADLRVEQVDLADLESVRTFADDEVVRGPLDVLVNNAGVMLVPQRHYTVDGHEMHMGVNHLGHFALTAGLLPAIMAADRPRVVAVSSIAHRSARALDRTLSLRGHYTPMGAYGQSKLANLLFIAELDRRLRDRGLVAVAAHPGWSATELLDRGDKPGAAVRFSRWATQVVGSRPRSGARSQLQAATDPTLTGGEFIGPRFVLRGRPHPASRTGAAHDRAAAAWLWDKSTELTGATFR